VSEGSDIFIIFFQEQDSDRSNPAITANRTAGKPSRCSWQQTYLSETYRLMLRMWHLRRRTLCSTAGCRRCGYVHEDHSLRLLGWIPATCCADGSNRQYTMFPY